MLVELTLTHRSFNNSIDGACDYPLDACSKEINCGGNGCKERQVVALRLFLDSGVVGGEGPGGGWGWGMVGSGYVSKCDVNFKSVAVFGK